MTLLLILLACLQYLDLYTTKTVLDHGGRELNPVVAQLMREIGVVPALVVKGISVTALGYWGGPSVAGVLCAVYAGVVIFNWRAMPK